MWFIGVEVEQETSAPPPKKILDPPLYHPAGKLTPFHRSPIRINMRMIVIPLEELRGAVSTIISSDGPFMKGWYARIIDFESNYSFGIIFGQVIRRKQGVHFNNYPLNMVSIIHSKGDESSMESFEVYPSSENVEVTVRGKPVTYDPDFKSLANFEWRAEPYGLLHPPRVDRR